MKPPRPYTKTTKIARLDVFQLDRENTVGSGDSLIEMEKFEKQVYAFQCEVRERIHA